MLLKAESPVFLKQNLPNRKQIWAFYKAEFADPCKWYVLRNFRMTELLKVSSQGINFRWPL
jgi:hypothetical protein